MKNVTDFSGDSQLYIRDLGCMKSKYQKSGVMDIPVQYELAVRVRSPPL